MAALACVVVGALLHPTTAVAAEPSRASATTSARLAVTAAPDALRGFSGRKTTDQAAAWHLDRGSVTTRTTPGGSVVRFTRGAVTSDGADGGSDFRAKVRWWGYYLVLFNRLETLRIAAGPATCAAVVKHVPLIGKYLAPYCGLISVIATYARARNTCVLVRGWGLQVPHIRMYRGGYCR